MAGALKLERNPEQDYGVDRLGHSLFLKEGMLSSVLMVLITIFMGDHI